jgi:hypothetical protein
VCYIVNPIINYFTAFEMTVDMAEALFPCLQSADFVKSSHLATKSTPEASLVISSNMTYSSSCQSVGFKQIVLIG